MKRILIYIAILVGLLLMPMNGTDVGKLRPVEVVCLYEENGEIVLLTDTGDKGTGKTVKLALEELKQTTPGNIFLDTADFLLIREGAEGCLEEMEAYLKENVRICKVGLISDLTQAAKYLSVHKPKMKLKDRKKIGFIQTLSEEDGGLYLR